MANHPAYHSAVAPWHSIPNSIGNRHAMVVPDETTMPAAIPAESPTAGAASPTLSESTVPLSERYNLAPAIPPPHLGEISSSAPPTNLESAGPVLSDLAEIAKAAEETASALVKDMDMSRLECIKQFAKHGKFQSYVELKKLCRLLRTVVEIISKSTGRGYFQGIDHYRLEIALCHRAELFQSLVAVATKSMLFACEKKRRVLALQQRMIEYLNEFRRLVHALVWTLAQHLPSPPCEEWTDELLKLCDRAKKKWEAARAE